MGDKGVKLTEEEIGRVGKTVGSSAAEMLESGADIDLVVQHMLQARDDEFSLVLIERGINDPFVPPIGPTTKGPKI